MLAATKLLGLLVRDVVLTRDEIRELMESLLVSTAGGPLRPTRFSEWLDGRGESIGLRWASELARNYRMPRG